jgi:hypothetical protein
MSAIRDYAISLRKNNLKPQQSWGTPDQSTIYYSIGRTHHNTVAETWVNSIGVHQIPITGFGNGTFINGNNR